MKIIFLNTWGGKCTDALSAFLEEQAPTTDVFCLQEVTRDVVDMCKTALPNHILHTGFDHDSVYGTFRQATYLARGITPISSQSLTQTKEDGAVLYSELESKGSRIHVFNVHGPSRPDKYDTEARIKLSENIIHFLKDKVGTKIVGGDFNVDLDTKSVQLFVEHGYRHLIKEYAITTTRNRLAWELYDTAFYYSDYVFTNTPVTNFEVIDGEISDHLPMILEIDE